MKLPKFQLSKGVKINGTESKVLVTMAIIVAVSMFCLISSKQLLKQASYQRKVINSKNAAANQLKQNVTAAQSLVQKYDLFNNTNPNIIGGKNTKDQNAVPPDGDNSRIVLDALPSKYDFPALLTSLYKLMGSESISSPSVSATDQSETASQPASASPSPVAMPLAISGTGSYSSILAFVSDLEKSVRPFDVTSISLSGSNDN